MERDRDCGASLTASLAKWNRVSFSWKTSQPCESEGLTKCLETLPSVGSMRNGQLWEPSTSERRIDGRDCSFWPTATASRCGSSQDGQNASRPSAGTASLDTLGKNWPTPVKTDAKDAARGTTTTGVMHPGETLTDAIRVWCTRHRLTMRKAGQNGSGTAVLNPEFVEALMGLPMGWTHVDDADAYDALVMQLPPGKQQRLF
jgi:hypothetical protein